MRGNLGCDGSGSATGSTNTTILSSGNYYAHWKNVACSGDPSVNHLIISTDSAAMNYFSTNTDSDLDTVTFSTGVRQVYYLMWAGSSGSSGVAYAQSQFQAVLNAIANVACTPGAYSSPSSGASSSQNCV